jgi:hypothetical protein
VAQQKAYFPPEAESYFKKLQIGPDDSGITAKIVQWDDNSLSFCMELGPAYVQVRITPEQCQQLAAALTAADRAAREVH